MFKPAIRILALALLVACCAQVQPTRGDSLGIYSGQMAPGPAADAVNAGIVALGKGDLTQAERSFQQALKIKPDEPHALVLMADVALRRRNPAQALLYLRTAVDKNPKSAAAEEAMGRYLADQKQYAGAQSALEKSVQLDPKWIVARVTLGDFYLSRGRSTDALASYRAAVVAAPNSPDAHYSLAKGLEATGDQRSAEEEFRTSVRVAPQLPLTHIALGDLLARTGRSDAGIAEYETAARLEPHSGQALARIGMAEQMRGHSDLAEQAYRKAILTEPNQLVALNNLAWIDLQSPPKLDEALSFAQRAVQGAPTGQFLDTLGWVYHAKGNNQQAVITLKKAIAASPQDPEVHYHLAVVYEDSGRPVDALAEMNKSLALKKDFPEAADAHKRAQELTKRLHH
jgi:tetratricopeptide (TPR) repeat protein